MDAYGRPVYSNPSSNGVNMNAEYQIPQQYTWQDKSMMARLAALQNNAQDSNARGIIGMPNGKPDSSYTPIHHLENTLESQPIGVDSIQRIDLEYRRNSHQAVEMAASALTNLGNGGNQGYNQSSTSSPRRIESAGSTSNQNYMGTKHSPSNNKKKRKPKNGDHTDDDSRRKTARACDQCRTKKIRCEIIIAPDVEEAHPHGMCKHCQSSNNECTFYMPITETRFKKKKVAEERHTSSPQAQGSQEISRKTSLPDYNPSAQETGNIGHLPDVSTYGNHVVQSPGEIGSVARHSDQMEPEKSILPKAGMSGRSAVVDGRVEGPTSLSYILHSVATLPRNSVEEYDIRNHQTWQFTTDDGDGIIRVCNPPPSSSFKHTPGPADTSPGIDFDGQTKPVLTAALISTLVNSYFTHISPLFPIVCKTQFVKDGNPPPLLLYAMAGVASTRRGVKREVFNAIRGVINGLIRNNDVLSDPSLTNVQALLILSMAADLHAQPTSTAVSASVTRISAAIRMAQNLGLHRESVSMSNDHVEMAKIEVKRRLWAVCVIMDRWVAACLGLPMMIDITDCDCLLPSPYEITRNEDGTTAWDTSGHQPYAVLTEHLKLSILLGRVLKCIYSPVGLAQTTNEQLGSLINDMQEWQSRLPPDLQYSGPSSNTSAGMLHLGHVAVQFLFWRTFMRLAYSLPPHIKLSMNMQTYEKILSWSTDAINWLSQHEEAVDTIYIFSYAINNAALIQYHTWVRRRNPRSLEMLKMLRDVVQRWENAVQPDHMSIRRKTIEVMSLLYEAAKKAHGTEDQVNTTPLNPTPGLKHRDPSILKRIVWVPDPAEPGKGVFVATNMDADSRKLQEELPPGVLITGLQQSEVTPTNNTNMYANPVQPQINMQYGTGNPYNGLDDADGLGQNNGAQSVSYLNLNAGFFPQMAYPSSENGNDADMNVLLNLLDQNNSEALTQAQLLDSNLLMGLPPNFDFNAWNNYFSQIF